MPRYINANLAKAQFTGNFQEEYSVPHVHALIDDVPTADVRKVIHAHWVDAEGIPVCSHCGHATEDAVIESYADGTIYVLRIPYYCGKCGAKMDEKKENEK